GIAASSNTIKPELCCCYRRECNRIQTGNAAIIIHYGGVRGAIPVLYSTGGHRAVIFVKNNLCKRLGTAPCIFYPAVGANPTPWLITAGGYYTIVIVRRIKRCCATTRVYSRCR